MKIVGITYYDGCENIVLKSDSSLLVNRKPLFVPDAVADLQALPCWVLRVSRLGKCIAPRFASRYYDAVAPGLDFFAADLLAKAKQARSSWTQAVAFESSLAVGNWLSPTEGVQSSADCQWLVQHADNTEQLADNLVARTEELNRALEKVSNMLTIRQGDLIYVAIPQQPWRLEAEDTIRCLSDEKEHLYCKIK